MKTVLNFIDDNQENVLKCYEINCHTMALLSVAHMNYSTIVVEVNRILYVRQSAMQIVKASCIYGGATYDGRRTAVIYLTGSKRKVPIPIAPESNIFAFPTLSPTQFGCNWIFYDHVKYIKTMRSVKDTTIKSVIIFKSGQQITLNESHYVLEKQMQRTAVCILRFTPRKSER